MAKKRIFDLPETKGEFKARGIVKGTSKDKFYQLKTTAKGKPKRILKFELQVQEDGSKVYCELSPTVMDNVYFYKQGDKKAGIKGVSKAIPFDNRNSFKEEGFDPIGIKVGLEQYIDDKGSLKNKNVSMFDYDGVEYLSKTLQEDIGVFVKGKTEFSSYINGTTGDKVRMTKFIPNQISGVTSDINFEDEKFLSVNDFVQTIVFMGAEMDESDPEDKKGVISSKIIGYSTIEDVEFIVRDAKIFKTFKKNLKPYTAVKVFGKIHNKVEKEIVEDDGWGTSNNSFEHKGNSFTKELLILGADPSTIDKDTYSKALLEEAIELVKASKKAQENYGDESKEEGSDWGSSDSTTTDDEIEGWD